MNKDVLEMVLRNLREIRLPMMAEQIMMLVESNEIENMTVEEVLTRISAEELVSRKNSTIKRLKKKAKLSERSARLEEINCSEGRKINLSVINQLRSNDYITDRRNVIIMGACGTGKSYIANALGNHACESYFTVSYCRFFEFIDECNRMYFESNSLSETLREFSRHDVLILDDFLIHELSSNEANYIFQLIELRCGRKTTIVCTQLEPNEWHSKLGGNLLAEAVIDRIIANSYKLILEGSSLRAPLTVNGN